jgi:hypothetical protein
MEVVLDKYTLPKKETHQTFFFSKYEFSQKVANDDVPVSCV